MNEMKRVLALVLCFVMLVGVLPIGALGTEVETTAPSETVALTQETEAAAATTEAAGTEAPTEATGTEPADTIPQGTESDEDVIPEGTDDADAIPEGTESDGETLPEDDGIMLEGGFYAVSATGEVSDKYVIAPTYENTAEEVTAYKLVATPEVGKQYLIVSTNSGNGYGLDTDTAGYAVSQVTDGYFATWDASTKTGTPLADTDVYITVPSGATLWTVGGQSGAYTFRSNNVYLRLNQNGELRFTNDTSRNTWRYQNNILRNNTAFYGAYYARLNSNNNQWSLSWDDSANPVYFYEQVTIYQDTSEQLTQGGTYTLVATDMTSPATNLNVPLFSWVEWDGPEAENTVQWTLKDYTVTEGFSIFETGEPYQVDGQWVIDLSGNVGTATVEVTYTAVINDKREELVKTFTVTTYDAEPIVEIVDQGSVDPITTTIIIKGEDEFAEEYSLDYLVLDKTYGDSVELGGTAEWVTSNENIAVMVPATDSAGNEIPGAYNVKFVGEGSVDVTVEYTYEDPITNEKKTITDTVKFSVSKSKFIVPSDGTDDFPEYPNEGSVRLSKTATGVGAFSQTSIAQVELSLAGVPYDTGEPVDVVIMVDMSSSMDEDDSTSDGNGTHPDRVAPAKNATINAVKKLVMNEAGEFNGNRVAVYSFATKVNPKPKDDTQANGSIGMTQFTTTQQLQELIGTQDANGTYSGGIIGNWGTATGSDAGTNYAAALEQCEYILRTTKREGVKQFCIFITDGGPTTGYAYADNDDYSKDPIVNNWYYNPLAGDGGNITDDEIGTYYLPRTEYYSYKMKSAGVEVYTIGIQMFTTRYQTTTELTNSKTLLQQIAGVRAEKEGGGYGNADATDTGFEKYAKFVGNDVDELNSLFQSIVGEILQAATDIKVHDVVSDSYRLILDLPAEMTDEMKAGLPDGFQPYIRVVAYTLDEDKNRTGEPEILETVYLNSPKVTKDENGKLIIDADKFNYNEATQTLKWEEEKLEIRELAIQYFVYLEGSEKADFPADTYPTNEFAYVTYKNYRYEETKVECQKYFPVPQLTWQGAQVTYKFYLVNEAGQPVNRVGRVVPFNEAVYVTEKGVTKAVTWNKEAGSENTLAEQLLAIASVPKVYQLYDPSASYEIHVYQKEGPDGSFTNYNHFEIGGDPNRLIDSEMDTDKTADNSTTKVFNNQTDVNKYDKYGVYSAQKAGSEWSYKDKDGNTVPVKTDFQATDIDYAATTVAFAVVWTKTLKPDTVVMDYGLDLVIDVTQNDAVDCDVVGVSGVPVSGVTMNSGLIPDGTLETIETTIGINTGDGLFAKIKVENSSSVRFTLDKANGMKFNKPAKFYYVSGASYYDTDNSLVTKYMYSEVNVVPATTVYYEDNYVTLNHYNKNTEGKYEEGPGWPGATVKNPTFTQDQDRPGDTGLIEDLDKNNVYGFDSAYGTSSTHSMGSGATVTVTPNRYATATFEFYGTGFDVISLTSADTGMITVTVRDANGDIYGDIKPVDTYYGYTYGLYTATYRWDGYHWFLEEAVPYFEGEDPVGTLPTNWGPANRNDTYDIVEYMWQPEPMGAEPLYQVPVINWYGLPWGKYTVEVRAAYSEWFDHNTVDEEQKYDFTLDAIRIYDPIKPTEVVTPDDTNTGDVNEKVTVEDIYLMDKEAYPVYTEIRDKLLEKKSFDNVNSGDKVEGLIFIDDVSNFEKDKKYTVAQYEAYGPNNELYLAKGQTVAFQLNLPSNIADVQIGLKTANGKTVYATLAIDGLAVNPANISNSNTATDRYYSLGSYVLNPDAPNYNPVVSITNDATYSADGAILSLTKIKLTHTSAVSTADYSPFYVTKNAANTVVSMLNAKYAKAPVVLPEADLEVSVNGKNVKAGSNVTVKATTNDAVEYLTVNGALVTEFKQNEQTGERTWTAKVKAEEAGELQIAVTAYSAEDAQLDTVTQTVQVAAKNNGKVNQVVGQLLDKLFG